MKKSLRVPDPEPEKKAYIVTHTSPGNSIRKLASKAYVSSGSLFFDDYQTDKSGAFSPPWTSEEITAEQAEEILNDPDRFACMFTDIFAETDCND